MLTGKGDFKVDLRVFQVVAPLNWKERLPKSVLGLKVRAILPSELPRVL